MKMDKIKNLYRILVSGKFSTNLNVKSTCFAEIMALNEYLFNKWDVNFLLVFSLSMEAVQSSVS